MHSLQGISKYDEKDMGNLRDGAISIASNVIADVFKSSRLSGLEYITHGWHNHVFSVVYWTVRDLWSRFTHISLLLSFILVVGLMLFQDLSQGGCRDNKFILLISREVSSLQPHQTRHEVACLHFLKKNVPQISAPKVYAWTMGVPTWVRPLSHRNSLKARISMSSELTWLRSMEKPYHAKLPTLLLILARQGLIVELVD